MRRPNVSIFVRVSDVFTQFVSLSDGARVLKAHPKYQSVHRLQVRIPSIRSALHTTHTRASLRVLNHPFQGRRLLDLFARTELGLATQHHHLLHPKEVVAAIRLQLMDFRLLVKVLLDLRRVDLPWFPAHPADQRTSLELFGYARQAFECADSLRTYALLTRVSPFLGGSRHHIPH